MCRTMKGRERVPENMDMKEKAMQLRRAYHRQYRAAHPDKVRKYAETYWMKQAAKSVSGDDEQEQAED